MNKFVFAFLLALLGFSAQAQFRVEVSGVGLTQIPIAVATFRGDEAAPQKMGAIVRADLERSGQFRAVDSGTAPMDELERPDMSQWRQKGADALVTGSISRLADGKYDVRFRLWDVVRGHILSWDSLLILVLTILVAQLLKLRQRTLRR